jgi:hypothetical protein
MRHFLSAPIGVLILSTFRLALHQCRRPGLVPVVRLGEETAHIYLYTQGQLVFLCRNPTPGLAQFVSLHDPAGSCFGVWYVG